MSFAMAFWVSQLGPLSAVDQRDARKLRLLASAVAGPAAVEAAWEAGARLTLVEAVRLAIEAR
jgi:hypothetical protein